MAAPLDEIIAWLGLSLIPGLGNSLIRRLVEVFGSASEVFQAGRGELLKVDGIKEEMARKIVDRAFKEDPKEEFRRAEQNGARIITYRDEVYPPLLRQISSPPVLLYAKGKEIPKDLLFFALVGSRHPTPYGIKAAERIGLGLARRGLGVVSGLAKGIDAAAHSGCLRGKGFTIGVLGNGIDLVYPAENRRIYQDISEMGTLLSEFPMGSPPEPRHFPIRNRLISGLSLGVVVVEATRQSGSLITASMALEQGREVFAVPGSIDSFKSTGTHLLIKQGAKLVENAEDIVGEFSYPLQAQTTGGEAPTGPAMDLSGPEKRIYDLLGDYPLHIDDIARLGTMDVAKVSSVLMTLEIKGWVKQLQGKTFVR